MLTLNSTHASIIPHYLPDTAPDRRIDMCIYIDPSVDLDNVARINTLRRGLPNDSISYTSSIALRNCPVPCSIEIKRSAIDFDGAVLQVGVWQAAHWKMLRILLRDAARRRHTQSTQGNLFIDEDAERRYIDESFAKLGTLHGIYSQGHEWYYVAASPEFVDGQGNPSLRTVRDFFLSLSVLMRL